MRGVDARVRQLTSAVSVVALALVGMAAVQLPAAALEATSYTLVGDLQSELGCSADWQETCTATDMSPVPGADGDVATTVTVPGGTYGFKVVTDHSWSGTAYGFAGSTAPDAANIPLVLDGPTALRFVLHTATGRTDVVPVDLQADAEADATPASPVRQAGSGNQYYFAMTDRFANGDTSNDTGGITGADATDRLVTGYDPTDKGFYEGGDLAGLSSRLDYIKGLGTTAIWLTPSFKNKFVQGAGTADVSAGYHGYWITDFTQIDPHFGTEAELESLIAAAHAKGMKVYFDIITNHTADVIQYTQAPAAGQYPYPYVPLATAPYKDAAGTAFSLVDQINKPFPAMNAASFPYTPTVPAAEATEKVPAWLNDVTLYHNRGSSTYAGESSTLGDFGNLDDLMTENPVVVDGMAAVYERWVDTGIDGFRIDTVKHVNTEFWQSWSQQVMDYAHSKGKADFFMFGEVYDADATKTSPYVRSTQISSVLDFSFQSAATSYAKGGSAKSLAALYASDDYYTTPTTSAYALPTFLGNHDMGRIGSFLAASGSPVQRDELAHDLMFLTRGQPVVYYGDEQGFAGPGGDKDARQSLFGTQVSAYANQPLVDGTTLGAGDHYATSGELYQHIAALGALRAAHPALVSGAQVEQYVADGPGVYAFSRVDTAGAGTEYLVAVNNADSPQSATFTALTPSTTFTALYGTTTGVTSAADGTVTLDVPALSAVVLTAGDGLPARTAGISASIAGTPGAPVVALNPVAVTLGEQAYAETTISARVAGASSWTTLGTSDTGAPRVFHTTAGLAPGALVEYRAVVKDVSGHTTVASSYATVGEGYGPGSAQQPDTSSMVTVPGNHNTEMGCTADWDPACTSAALAKRDDGTYAATFSLPAGSYEYKVAVGGSWDVNYGAGQAPGGANLTYTLAATTDVTFTYDPVTHLVTSSATGPLITAAGDFQSELGCPGDWQPSCLRSWLENLNGDGHTYVFATSAIPPGSYQVKAAYNQGWDESYPAANVPFVVPAGPAQVVTFTFDSAAKTLVVTMENPPLAGRGQAQAHWVDARTIAWPTALLPAGADPTTLSWALHSSPTGGLDVDGDSVTGGDSLALTYDPAGLSAAAKATFPALAGYLALTVPVTTAQATTLLTGELQVSQSSATGALTALTGVQVPGVLDDLYGAAAHRTLGVTWTKGRPSLALWAPTATSVSLLLRPDGVGGATRTVPAVRQPDGSWTVDGAKSWKGASYLWKVEVYVASEDAVMTSTVTDPYSVALTTNSTASVLVDLDDRAYQPRIWRTTPAPTVARPVDRTIYELHVRDFSIADTTVPAKERGTYLAFTRNSDGMKHLRTLAKAGLNTVHLLPTFDIATIQEDRSAQATPACDLASYPADSDQQQACVAAVKDADGYNWGYDPYHFQAPEGSYAVDPNGGARVSEFRSMVGALHATGLQVVLDEVYNHTSASGQADTSVLDKVVPGYYQRLDGVGQVQTSTCCQNVATEHAMAQKLMVDSVVLWAKDYKVDGFRFDLMGHHSKANMLAVRAALDALTLKKDGVDGKKIYLYGEGWNFGEVANNALFTQATQGQLGGTGIGTFSDRLRDAVRGGSPVASTSTYQQGFGTGLATDPNGKPTDTSVPGSLNTGSAAELADLQHQSDLVRLGLAGNLRSFSFLTSAGTVQRGDQLDYRGAVAGYADQPDEVVTYVDAHDNETLFDTLAVKLPTTTPMADRVRMNTLSLATVTLSQTPSFWQAGTDMLRSKSLDRNSYNSGDWFNSIDWTGKDNGFGRGLPMAADNSGSWAVQGPLLANPSLKPAATDIATASTQAQDLLRLRSSTRLFRLGSASLIDAKVTFPGSGPSATPGVIVMSIDDTVGTDVDPRLDGALVVFNASPTAVTQRIATLAGRQYVLAPVQAAGQDPVVKQTRWSTSTGTVTVPARTVAVLVDSQDHHGHCHHGGHWTR